MSAQAPKLAPRTARAAQPSVPEIAGRARAASRLLAKLPHERRNAALSAVADAIEEGLPGILAANAEDCRAAAPLVSSGQMSAAMLARLGDQSKLAKMPAYLRSVARLPDPLGRRLMAMELDDGLVLYKETCPLGVVGIVFEARPEVISQVAALTLKSGNAVILKGGSEAARTNDTIVSLWRETLS
ncbi:MAG TPA: gamma-glutamyl-phosphate reductase, partial [Terriglobia bacterium]|nr:gamma-glutamyl-phosphate reductase [Terriglobia bacterium]